MVSNSSTAEKNSPETSPKTLKSCYMSWKSCLHSSNWMIWKKWHINAAQPPTQSSQFCSSSSSCFIRSEIDYHRTLSQQIFLEQLLCKTFEDLNKLRTSQNSEEVEKAISKYSTCLLEGVEILKNPNFETKSTAVMNKLSEMMSKAWLIPTYGHELGNRLCDVLRECGGLDALICKCDVNDDCLKFSSFSLLEQCLTTDNRAYVAENDLLQKVGRAIFASNNGVEFSRVSTGILSHLFKHNEDTCKNLIKLGGLDIILNEGRKNDLETLRNCASAFANLSLYGGAENQETMIKLQVPMWLYPLAFHNDDIVKYYACLAIVVLVNNKEVESEVLRSGTLELVEPFVTIHNPSDFAKSNSSHAHGQSPNWLQRLLPLLSSKHKEAQNLAAFHFCMEAGLKKSQGNTMVFAEIGAIECLKNLASLPGGIASKFAAQALRLMDGPVPHKLIQQVPLWSIKDVIQWVIQIGFDECSTKFEGSRVDGDLLLQLTEDNLKDDIGIKDGIKRKRFMRALQTLKKVADYSSCDENNLNGFLQKIDSEFSIYTYSILNAGIDRNNLRYVSEEQFLKECGIVNSIHRLRIFEEIKRESNFSKPFQSHSEKIKDVFISYRRSNGSQLASLLKVHLQLRNLSVFIDVEKLAAGKFDNNLLRSIKQARNFILVLTPNALDGCIGDDDCKDWVHKEIVAALENNCNIVPILDNFQWPAPADLPKDMRAICRFNGVLWTHDYQNACVDKLESFCRDGGSPTHFDQDLPPPRRNSNPCNFQRTICNDSNRRFGI